MNLPERHKERSQVDVDGFLPAEKNDGCPYPLSVIRRPLVQTSANFQVFLHVFLEFKVIYGCPEH